MIVITKVNWHRNKPMYAAYDILLMVYFIQDTQFQETTGEAKKLQNTRRSDNSWSNSSRMRNLQRVSHLVQRNKCFKLGLGERKDSIRWFVQNFHYLSQTNANTWTFCRTLHFNAHSLKSSKLDRLSGKFSSIYFISWKKDSNTLQGITSVLWLKISWKLFKTPLKAVFRKRIGKTLKIHAMVYNMKWNMIVQKCMSMSIWKFEVTSYSGQR